MQFGLGRDGRGYSNSAETAIGLRTTGSAIQPQEADARRFGGLDHVLRLAFGGVLRSIAGGVVINRVVDLEHRRSGSALRLPSRRLFHLREVIPRGRVDRGRGDLQRRVALTFVLLREKRVGIRSAL